MYLFQFRNMELSSCIISKSSCYECITTDILMTKDGIIFHIKWKQTETRKVLHDFDIL